MKKFHRVAALVFLAMLSFSVNVEDYYGSIQFVSANFELVMPFASEIDSGTSFY